MSRVTDAAKYYIAVATIKIDLPINASFLEAD
jgi:hypothetical protein